MGNHHGSSKKKRPKNGRLTARRKTGITLSKIPQSRFNESKGGRAFFDLANRTIRFRLQGGRTGAREPQSNSVGQRDFRWPVPVSTERWTYVHLLFLSSILVDEIATGTAAGLADRRAVPVAQHAERRGEQRYRHDQRQHQMPEVLIPRVPAGEGEGWKRGREAVRKREKN